MGRIVTDNVTVDKAQINLTYFRTFEPVKNFSLSCKQDYVMNLYYGKKEQFQALTSEISSKYEYKINKKVKLSTNLSWLKTVTDGNNLLDDDEIEKEERLESALSLELKTSQPGSALIIENNNIYDIKSDEWTNIKVGVTRKYDCYNLQLNYDFIDNTVEFNMNL